MAINKATIKQAILDSISGNGSENNKDKDQSIDKFADDLAEIVKNAIQSADVKILSTELTTKVSSISGATGGPVICTQNLSGSLE